MDGHGLLFISIRCVLFELHAKICKRTYIDGLTITLLDPPNPTYLGNVGVAHSPAVNK